jgi:hypothetical protein
VKWVAEKVALKVGHWDDGMVDSMAAYLVETTVVESAELKVEKVGLMVG